MDDSYQRQVSRLVAKSAQMLLSHGAESYWIASLAKRIGLACGADEVEISLTPNSIIATIIIDSHCITTVREAPDRGINMIVVSDLLQLCISLETKAIDLKAAQDRIDSIRPVRYPRFLVMFVVAISCATFAFLAGGDGLICLTTFCASLVGMFVRQEIAKYKFNPLVNFFFTSFVTTLISSQAALYKFGNEPFIAMASSVLMLVPGFPLINAVADMLKGYASMGVARFVMASLLTFATSLGIVAAMTLTGAWDWLQ